MTPAALLRDARRKAEECEHEFWHPAGEPAVRVWATAKTACGVSAQGDPAGPAESFERRHLDAHIAAAWQASLASVAGEAWDASKEWWRGGADTTAEDDERKAATVGRLAGDETRA